MRRKKKRRIKKAFRLSIRVIKKKSRQFKRKQVLEKMKRMMLNLKQNKRKKKNPRVT